MNNSDVAKETGGNPRQLHGGASCSVSNVGVAERIENLTLPPAPQQQHRLLQSVASLAPSRPGSGTNTPPTLNPTHMNQPHHSLQPAAAPFYAHQQRPSSSHNNSAKTKLRSGKWIPEEDAYARQLIEAFEKGVASDCANGSTLRSYLALKLRCAPMRISKKFAGKGIGKMVYLSKMTRQADPTLTTKLRETELKFQQAIFPVVTDFFSVRNMLVVQVVQCRWGCEQTNVSLYFLLFPTAPSFCESRRNGSSQLDCGSPGVADAPTRGQATCYSSRVATHEPEHEYCGCCYCCSLLPEPTSR